MLISLEKKMIILFLLLYTALGSIINGTSPLTSTMNLLGYEPLIPFNSSSLQTDVMTHVQSAVKRKKPNIPPKQINYVTKHIDSCPGVGYFFKREQRNSIDASQCYLCFCSDPKWAICWPRENQRCDNEHYHHHGVGKRDARARRSPGFSDIFFRDASLDIFGKNAPEQCKPYEASFSEGCPPADWCIGCTVCDCDSNGRWDCHTLSFCPDQEVKGKDKKDRHYKKGKVYKQKGSKNAILNQKNIGKVKSKTTQKGPSDQKTAATRLGNKVMAHIKKGPQINQPANKKSKVKKNDKFGMPGNKSSKKSTTQVVKMPTKKKQEVKKNMKRTGIISKRDAKNKNAPLKKNASKRNNTVTKNKSKRILSGKSVPPKNNQPKKSNLVKKTKPVKKAITPKKTTEAKTNLRQYLKQKPKKSATSKYAKDVKSTKKPISRKISAKILKATSEKPMTDNKKQQASKRKKKQFIKKKANTERPQNLKADLKKVAEREMEIKAQKHIKKRSTAKNAIEYDFIEGVDNKERVKRHITDSLDPVNTTKVVDSIHETVNKNVNDMWIDQNKSDKSTASKSSTINVDLPNEFVEKSFFTNKDINVSVFTESAITENRIADITTKPLIGLNKTDFSTSPSAAVIKTTTIMYVEPTVSLSSYFMYTVDDAVNSTSEFGHTIEKMKNYSAKRSLSDVSTLKNLVNTTSDSVFEILDLDGTSIHTTESQDQRNATTQTYNKIYEGRVQNNRSQNKDLFKSEQNPRLEPVNRTIQNLKDRRRKIYSSDLTRKLGNTEKKYKLRKIVNVYSRNATRLDELFKVNYKQQNITDKRLNLLQKFIRNHISVSKRRSFTNKSGTHNIKVMTYLKKFLKKILTTQKKNKVQNDTTSLTINKSKFIKTLCETFGPCYLTQQKRLLLNAKVDDLSIETNKMFKIIKVLKGLLKLLNLDKNNKTQNTLNEERYSVNFNTDLRKLGSILRDNYIEEQKENLTTTEVNQINHVKRNMQLFTQSTARFAKFLNEIIDVVITPGNTSKSKKKVEAFQKLKGLLLSYKVMQSRYLQKIYEILRHIYPVQPNKNISAVDKANNTATLHVYTKNIIKNLRRLKNLAQVALSKTTTHARKRRDLREEESMEYILVLMEYFLKQNYQTDPVNDWIELLIEAIKNAPDIKLIQKQLLQKNLEAYNVSNIYSHTGENNIVRNNSDHNVSELNKVSRELNNTSQQDELKMNNIDSIENESDFEFMPVSNRRVNVEKAFTTAVNDYTEPITEDTVILELSSAKPQKESSFVSPAEPTLHTIPPTDEYTKKIEKVVNSGEDYEFEKRMDIFTGDLDDETLKMPIPSSTMRSRQKTKYHKPLSAGNDFLSELVTEKYNENVNHGIKDLDLEGNVKNYFKDDTSLSMSESKNKKYLDWLDESFEEEIKEINDTEKVKPLLQTLPTQETVLKRHLDKDNSLSKETYNAKKRNIGLKDKIYIKEMNLLNSLDDNVGKSNSDGSDSIDTLDRHDESD